MKQRAWLIVLGVQSMLVVGFSWLLRNETLPLGVPGEWVWDKARGWADFYAVSLALVVLVGYALLAAAGFRAIRRGGRSWPWLVVLLPTSLLVQAAIEEGAPAGYGLAKWAIALHSPGASGYYTVAKTRMPDLGRFLADYPGWIKTQDALHIGTHPPGLFVVSWAFLRLMEANPGLTRAVNSLRPGTLDLAFKKVDSFLVLPAADRASLVLTGFSIALACAATVVPVYALARIGLSASGSWVAAVLWTLAPAAIMFQPAADTAFGLFSASALACVVWSRRWPSLALVAGLVLGVGTQFSLVFFPIGLIAALLLLTDRQRPWRRRLIAVGATGLGFLVITGFAWGLCRANPFETWWNNAANHARFYVEYPRSYRAWVIEAPFELAVALGIATSVWLLSAPRRLPAVSWATLAVLAFLAISGKNLSEVARLWLPMMPALVVGAAHGIDAHEARPIGVALTLILLGIQTLVLQATIQVVLPAVG